MLKYTIKVNFIFSGDITIKAKSRAEAEKIISENVWARQAKVADNEHPQIEDWGISCTSDKTVIIK